MPQAGQARRILKGESNMRPWRQRGQRSSSPAPSVRTIVIKARNIATLFSKIQAK
jgi:hypothetical protein